MRELKVGESYTGDELIEILGESYDELLLLRAVSNDKVRLILKDEGNDNYELLHIIEVKKE